MREPRQVIADWYGDDRLAEIGDAIIGALEAEGYRIVGEGQAVIGGEVVTLQEVRGQGGSVQPIAYRRGKWVLGNESDAWMDQRTAFVIEVPS